MEDTLLYLLSCGLVSDLRAKHPDFDLFFAQLSRDRLRRAAGAFQSTLGPGAGLLALEVGSLLGRGPVHVAPECSLRDAARVMTREPGSDEIVSVGWVCLQGARIHLSTAGHLLVKPTREMPETSAVINHITDDVAARGVSLRDALDRLLPVLAGSVLVAHNAEFEVRFLAAACASTFGGGFLTRAVDTLELASRSRWHEAAWGRGADGALTAPGGRPNLRLDALRRAHGLPRYPAHDALSDALAVGERFLAQLARSGLGPVPLRRVLLSGL